MAAYGLMTMYNLTAKIGTQKSGSAPSETWTYAELAEGIDNIAEALNETVQQYFFLSDDGFARNHVTGMAPAFTLTGRQSSFQISYVDAEGATVEITCDCTICNIQEWSGATTDDSAISFEIRFDGKPETKTTPAG